MPNKQKHKNKTFNLLTYRWWKKNPAPVDKVNIPYIYMVLYIPVVWDFFHQQYGMIPSKVVYKRKAHQFLLLQTNLFPLQTTLDQWPAVLLWSRSIGLTPVARLHGFSGPASQKTCPPPKTNSKRPWKWAVPKRNLYSNHQFSGDMLVSGMVLIEWFWTVKSSVLGEGLLKESIISSTIPGDCSFNSSAWLPWVSYNYCQSIFSIILNHYGYCWWKKS